MDYNTSNDNNLNQFNNLSIRLDLIDNTSNDENEISNYTFCIDNFDCEIKKNNLNVWCGYVKLPIDLNNFTIPEDFLEQLHSDGISYFIDNTCGFDSCDENDLVLDKNNDNMYVNNLSKLNLILNKDYRYHQQVENDINALVRKLKNVLY